MAVVSAHIMSAGISGDAKGKDSSEAKTSYRVRYFAQCDSPSDTAKTVIDFFRRTSGYPYIGDTYSAGGDRDGEAICSSITPSLIDKSGGMFHVDVDYSPASGDSKDEKPSSGNPNKTTTDPRDWHDEVDVSYTQISIPCELAIFRGFSEKIKNRFLKEGKPTAVSNSAGVPFDPTIDYEVDIKIVRFYKYGPAFDGDGSNRWIGVVNSDAVSIRKQFCRYVDTWGPQTARIKGIPSTFGVANGIPYWRLGVEVHISPLGWRRWIVDRGTHARQAEGDRRYSPTGDGAIISPTETGPGSPMLAVIKDEDGYPVSEPVLLDGNGQPLEKGKPAVLMQYQVYEERSFAGIRW